MSGGWSFLLFPSVHSVPQVSERRTTTTSCVGKENMCLRAKIVECGFSRIWRSNLVKSRSLTVLVLFTESVCDLSVSSAGWRSSKTLSRSPMDLKQACSICSTSGSSGEGRVRAIHRSSFLILTAGNRTISAVMNPLHSGRRCAELCNAWVYPKCGYLILLRPLQVNH